MCTSFVQNLRKLLGVQVAFPETILILPWDIFWYISIYRKLRHWLSSFFHGFESILVTFDPPFHDLHLYNGLETDIKKLPNRSTQ